MSRDRPATPAEDLAQREDDYQRWADGGGSTPDPRPDRPTPPITAMPVRPVYRREAGGLPFASLVSTAVAPTR
jgi:hypothetical protein